MDQPLLSIIVPALNEERHIADSVKEALRAAELTATACEVIVVDDGSTDRTGQVALRLAEQDARVRLVRNPHNLGLGGAYKEGLAVARGAYVTWVPADASHPAEGLLAAYRSIGEADIILPKPTNPEARARSRRIISRLYTVLVNLITGFRVPYYNGLSVHRADLLRAANLATNNFGFQAEAIAKLLLRGASYKVVDTLITERQLGHSKAFRLRNVLSVVKTLGRILLLSLRARRAVARGRTEIPRANKPAGPLPRR
jgi:glycosyltransferase involved in cell wall biosynthesis